MKLANSIILALAVASFVIGVHQTFTLGFEQTYWIFMITVSLTILNRILKPADPAREEEKEKRKAEKKRKKNKKKKKDPMQGNRQMRRAMRK